MKIQVTKIQIIGENSAAKALRDHLEFLGYSTARFGAAYCVRMTEIADERISIAPSTEGKYAAFATVASQMVKELTSLPVNRVNSAKSAELEVGFPAASGSTVELGVLRALLTVTEHGAPQEVAAQTQPASLSWLKKIFG